MRIFVAVLALVSCSLFAADAPPGMTPEMMKKFEPGKEHAELKKLEGSYDVDVKMWMDPSQPPMQSKGSAEFKMVMNGRFLRQDYKGDMMGQPFTGIGHDGYDNVLKKYVSTWMDDFSTGIMYMQGESKDGGKTIEVSGEQGCPMTDKPIKMRTVHKKIDDNKFVFEMYNTVDGKETKGMELTYTRKK
jgi:hypothetical protein